MADVNTQELFDLKLQRFGIGTAGVVRSRFDTTFFGGCKYVCATIRSKAAGISLTTPTDLASDFAGLDEDIWYAAVSSGLDYFITTNGEWQDKPDGKLGDIWARDLNLASMQYYRDEVEIVGRVPE